VQKPTILTLLIKTIVKDQICIFPQLAKMCPPKLTLLLQLLTTFFLSLSNLCTFPPTSADEIRQIIASLKCKTTSNSYDIPAKFSKISASSLPSWLFELFNKCINV